MSKIIPSNTAFEYSKGLLLYVYNSIKGGGIIDHNDWGATCARVIKL